MARSQLFDDVRRIFHVGSFCDEQGLPTSEGFARIEERRAAQLSRRNVVKGAGATLALGVASRSIAQMGPRITIIGAGMAGLAAADRLRAKGYSATLFEANTRIGGRVFSDRTTFPRRSTSLARSPRCSPAWRRGPAPGCSRRRPAWWTACRTRR